MSNYIDFTNLEDSDNFMANTTDAKEDLANAKEAKDIADTLFRAFQYVAHPKSTEVKQTAPGSGHKLTSADVFENKKLTFFAAGAVKLLYMVNKNRSNNNDPTDVVVKKFIWDSFVEQINENFRPDKIKLSSSGNKKFIPLFLWGSYKSCYPVRPIEPAEVQLNLVSFEKAQFGLKNHMHEVRKNISRIKSKISKIDQGTLTIPAAQKYEIWEEFIRSKFNTLVVSNSTGSHSMEEYIKNIQEQIDETDTEIEKLKQTLNAFVNAEQHLQRVASQGKAWILRSLVSTVDREHRDLGYDLQRLENKKQTLEDKISAARPQESDIPEEQVVINNFRKFLQDKLELTEFSLRWAEQDLNRITNIVKFVRKQVRKLNYIVPCPYDIVFK